MSKKRGRRNAAKEDHTSDYETDTYGLADGDDKTRPYYLVEDLPCSIDPPRYDTFTHPLSVKDSAVLYSSLLSSRRTWIKGEMFQLYWAKQYMNTKEKEELKKEGIDPDSIDQSAAREKMNKLCDCMMQGGPHQFPIRLFILKKDEVEKAWNEAKEAKKRDREVRKEQQEEEKRLKKERKLLRKKLKQEAREKEKEKNKDKVRKPRKPYKKSAKRLEAERLKEEEKAKAAAKKSSVAKKPNTASTVRKKKMKAVVRPKPYEEQVMILNLNKMARNDKQLNDLMIKVAGGQASLSEITQFKKYIEKAKAMPAPSGTWKPMLEEVEVTDDGESDDEGSKGESVKENKNSSASPEKPVTPNQSIAVEGHDKNSATVSTAPNGGKKITEDELKNTSSSEANQSDKAVEEPSTSTPDKGVDALNTKKSTVEGSKFVDCEREGENLVENTSDQKIEGRIESADIGKIETKAIDETIKEIYEKADKSHSDSNSDSDSDSDSSSSDESNNDEDTNESKSSTVNAEEKESSEKKDDTTTGKESTGEPNGEVAEPNGEVPPPRQKRKYRRRSKVKTEEEDEEEKAMQLTTFQQKYYNGADMVFEYVENANVRFLLPKYSIIEQLEGEESYLMSFIVIHNRREVALFTTRKLKELNKKKPKDQHIKTEDYNPFEDARCPDPLFSPITVKLTGIPKKFSNIIMNSFHPQERVQQYMKSIIDRGNRLSGYNLWYQLDAYDDKELAERLRVGLRDYEQTFKSKRQKKQIL
ncbi:unnamed protein product [Kluyveromyces dobzhanskii CBS 2104]|uniref:WGS project CCBQ000000000 data, contig 00015 n=1 Tax=Kluyveromyces dobzhanskii CBS 2104 TaxID=1427455 RepID=A0A0A8LC02_9SACH|nr:unnamed protein product [Kluyveromyces dobzhanskii CBS 2104]